MTPVTSVRAGRDALLGRRGAGWWVLSWGLLWGLVALVVLGSVLMRSGPLDAMAWLVRGLSVGVAPALAMATILVVRPPRWACALLLGTGVLAALGYEFGAWGFRAGLDAAENNTAAPPLSDYWIYGGFVFVLGTALLGLTLAVAGLVRGRRAAGSPSAPRIRRFSR